MKAARLIKKLRIERGMTQEDLSDKTGISVRSIQRIENGNVAPRADSLHKIAEALGVSFEELNALDIEVENQTSDNLSLSLLHISGLFLVILPSLIIWNAKSEIRDIRKHAIDVINFQLNMLAIMIPCGIFSVLMFTIPILIMTAILGYATIIINSARVAMRLPYRYPKMYSFLRS